MIFSIEISRASLQIGYNLFISLWDVHVTCSCLVKGHTVYKTSNVCFQVDTFSWIAGAQTMQGSWEQVHLCTWDTFFLFLTFTAFYCFLFFYLSISEIPWDEKIETNKRRRARYVPLVSDKRKNPYLLWFYLRIQGTKFRVTICNS